MDIKVNCSCGQRYAFDVEPVDGRMPVDITCPSCQASGTEQANALISDKLAAAPPVRVTIPAVSVPQSAAAPPRRPSPVVSVTSAPPVPKPVSPAVAPLAPTTVASAPSGLKLTRGPGGHPVPPPPAADAPAEDIAALMAPPPPSTTAKPAAPRKVEKVFGEPNLGKSIIGAAIGAALMTGIWFGLWKGTGGSWGIMAVAVGWMAGFFARLIGRSEGPKMGMATVLVAMVFIFGFQFYRATANESSLRLDTKDIDREFEAEQSKARELLKAIPNGSDPEIRAYMAGKHGQPDDPKEITPEAVEEFKKDDLAEARETVKQTKEAHRAEVKKFQDAVIDSAPMRVWFWINAIGIFSIVSIFIGLGAAYRFGSGEG